MSLFKVQDYVQLYCFMKKRECEKWTRVSDPTKSKGEDKTKCCGHEQKRQSWAEGDMITLFEMQRHRQSQAKGAYSGTVGNATARSNRAKMRYYRIFRIPHQKQKIHSSK